MSPGHVYAGCSVLCQTTLIVVAVMCLLVICVLNWSGIQNCFYALLQTPSMLMQRLCVFRRSHQQPAGPAEPHHRHVGREGEAEGRGEAHPAAEAKSSVRPVQDAC